MLSETWLILFTGDVQNRQEVEAESRVEAVRYVGREEKAANGMEFHSEVQLRDCTKTCWVVYFKS
jgi:hypothetical protein